MQIKDPSEEAVVCSVLDGCLLHAALKKEAAFSHEAFVFIQLTIRRHISELHDPSIVCHKYFKQRLKHFNFPYLTFHVSVGDLVGPL